MSIKSFRHEGGWQTGMVALMKKAGYNRDTDFEFGTVTSPPPNLKIKLDGMQTELEADDLLVLEHLTRHERIATIEHRENADRNVGDGTVKDILDTDDLQAPYTSFTYSNVLLRFEDVLKVGDRVIVASREHNTGADYIVLDRVVSYE